MTVTIIVGNCLEKLREMPADSVHACASSPPYWGLRDYGVDATLWGRKLACEHDFDEVVTEKELRLGTGLEELSKRYRGGGKKAAKVEPISAVTGTCRFCGAWRGALGLEPTPEMFVQHLADVYDEVRRVLRPDGTCWVNIGDSYYSGREAGGVGENSTINGQQSQEQYRIARETVRAGIGPTNKGGRANPANAGKHKRVGSNRAQRGDGNGGVPYGQVEQANRGFVPGLKPKDLVGVPWMLAFELRRRGWYLRQEIIWHKPNPMPESTEDRCTKAHEHVFLLAKSERYFYDAEAIKESASENTHSRTAKSGVGHNGKLPGVTPKSAREDTNIGAKESWHASTAAVLSSRNKRSVWTIATAPFKEAHFATFPPSLIEPMIKAGTSQRGCCPKCMAPWQRVTAPTERYLKFLGRSYHDHADDEGKGQMQQRGENRQNALREEGGIVSKEHETAGWYPTCACDGLPSLPPLPQSPRISPPDDADEDWEPGAEDKAALEILRAAWRVECGKVYATWREMCRPAERLKTVPAVVLDPFGGAGTTGLVADRLGRDAVLVELKAEYAEMARKRIEGDSLPLFAGAAE